MQEAHPLRIIHTSDWHLGRQLAGVDRINDFREFLSWLVSVLRDRSPDLLLIAGDVFDTTMPASDAQRLWYDFLVAASQTPVGAIVVTAGNHDSQRFLRAPAGLFAAVRTFVAGSTAEDEVFLFRDAEGHPRAAVAAVPYLREGDVRRSRESDSDEDRANAWGAGVAAHYRAAQEALDACLQKEGIEDLKQIPRITMGHLFVTGAKVAAEGNTSSRSSNIYVGSLRSVSANVFGDSWDYVALGHIHRPQSLASAVPVRYCGSPLALDPSESTVPHELREVTFSPEGITEEVIPVPQPRRLARLKGKCEAVEAQLREIGRTDPGAILELVIEEPQIEPSLLVKQLDDAAKKAGVFLSAVRTERQTLGEGAVPEKTLDDLTPEDVWLDVLARSETDAATCAELEPLFQEVKAVVEAQFREKAAAAAEATAEATGGAESTAKKVLQNTQVQSVDESSEEH